MAQLEFKEPATSRSASWELWRLLQLQWVGGGACTPDATGEPGPAGLVDEHVEAGEQMAAVSGPQDGHDTVYERVAVLAALVRFEQGDHALIRLGQQPRPQLAQVLLRTRLLLGCCSLCPAPPWIALLPGASPGRAACSLSDRFPCLGICLGFM